MSKVSICVGSLGGTDGSRRPSLPRCLLSLGKLSQAPSLVLSGAFPAPLSSFPSLSLFLQISVQFSKKMERLGAREPGEEAVNGNLGETEKRTWSLNSCVLWLQEPKSWNLLVGRKVLYQKHIGCRRSCTLPL